MVEALVAVGTALATAVVVLAVALVRCRERIVRLEEWARLHELGDRRER